MDYSMTGSKVAALSNDGGGGTSADNSEQVAGVKFNKKAGGSSASRGRGNGQRGKGRGGKARPPPPNPPPPPSPPCRQSYVTLPGAQCTTG